MFSNMLPLPRSIALGLLLLCLFLGIDAGIKLAHRMASDCRDMRTNPRFKYLRFASLFLIGIGVCLSIWAFWLIQSIETEFLRFVPGLCALMPGIGIGLRAATETQSKPRPNLPSLTLTRELMESPVEDLRSFEWQSQDPRKPLHPTLIYYKLFNPITLDLIQA